MIKSTVDAETAAILKGLARLSWADLSYAPNGTKDAIVVNLEAVIVEKVDSKDDSDEESSTLFVVVKVGDRFFKKTGYYQSHYGSDWDGIITEVKPTQKTITVYELI